MVNLNQIINMYIHANRSKRAFFRKNYAGIIGNRKVLKNHVLRCHEATKSICFDHLRRIDKSAKLKGSTIVNSNYSTLTQLNNFDAIHDLLHAKMKKVPGLGNLYIYDFAVLLAGGRGIEPHEYVYLHAGAMTGYKALMKGPYSYRILRSDLLTHLPAFRVLSSDEIEDLLCIYKDDLNHKPGKKSSCGRTKNNRGPRGFC